MSSINNRIKKALSHIDSHESSRQSAQRMLPLLDLTYYEGRDTSTIVRRLCQQAVTEYGSIAAVCVLPGFVKLARSLIHDDAVQIIALIDTLMKRTEEKILADIDVAIKAGATGIDIIFPYKLFLAGEKKRTEKFIRHASLATAHRARLFVTLQATELPNDESIYEASRFVIDAGADFIKTSSGRKAKGVTPEIAAAILLAIQDSDQAMGFKAAVGIQTLSEATRYLSLAEYLLGKESITPETFRIGADEKFLSSLFNCLTKL